MDNEINQTPIITTTSTNDQKQKENQQSSTSPRKIRHFIDLFKNHDLGFEKQKKQALYNLLAFSVFLFLILTVICCYFVLQFFLRPLIWALLIGVILHPFKRKLNVFILNWIDSLNDTHRPAILEFFFLPFNLTNYFLTTISKIIIQYGKLLGFVFLALLLLHLSLYYFIFTHKIWLIIINSLSFTFNLLNSIQLYLNVYVLFTLTIGHFSLLCFSWNSNTKLFLIKTTPFLWIILFCRILFLFNTIGTLFLIILISMLIIGILAKFYGIKTSKTNSNEQIDSVYKLNINLNYLKELIYKFILSLLPNNHLEDDELELTNESIDETNFSNLDDDLTCKNFDNHPIDASSPITKQVSFSGDKLSNESDLKLNKKTDKLFNKSILNRKNRSSLKRKSITRRNSIDKDITKLKTNNLSNTYLYALVWSCFLAQIYIRPRLLYLLPIPISLYIIRWLWKIIQDTELFNFYLNEFNKWIEERNEVIYNPIFCFIYEYLLVSDYVLSKTLKNAVDTLSSLFVILFVIFGAIFATLFLAFQIYHESALLVELTTNVMPTINSTYSTLVNSTADSEFGQMLPKDLINNNIAQEILTKAYLHGREWIQTTIRTSFNGENTDSNVTSAVEKQMLEVVDRIYHYWLVPHDNCTSNGAHGPHYRPFEVYNWNKLFSALKALNLKLCYNLIKENFDFIFSIFESIWSVLKGNLKLMISTIWAIISAFLTGGNALLSLALSLIVFLTSLFYLLASSNDIYKPMDLIVKFMIMICGSETVNVHRFEQAVESSITSIFIATFKMSFFYGLYTWLILTLSESSIIYIPSVLAALLGAVPFIGAYWAFLPAILEYWLVYSSGGKALLLLMFAILPSNFVDTAIYSEIKGGEHHPYLTGLAIGGGVYYFGSIEGAFLGPLLLCAVCVIIKFYTDQADDSD